MRRKKFWNNFPFKWFYKTESLSWKILRKKKDILVIFLFTVTKSQIFDSQSLIINWTKVNLLGFKLISRNVYVWYIYTNQGLWFVTRFQPSTYTTSQISKPSKKLFRTSAWKQKPNDPWHKLRATNFTLNQLFLKSLYLPYYYILID